MIIFLHDGLHRGRTVLWIEHIEPVGLRRTRRFPKTLAQTQLHAIFGEFERRGDRKRGRIMLGERSEILIKQAPEAGTITVRLRRVCAALQQQCTKCRRIERQTMTSGAG